MLIGVLALQGGFAAHGRTLHALGAEVREVREPTDLEAIDGLVIPGGESTTMTLGITREGLAEPLCALAAGGTPVLGTCAGMIMLDRSHLGLMDIDCRRNAFGRQVRSFEEDSSSPAWTARRCAPSSSALRGSSPTATTYRSSPSFRAARSRRARARCWPWRFTPSWGATRACTRRSSPRCARRPAR